MRDLEDAGLRRHEPRHDVALDVRTDVTRQQQRDLTVDDFKNDGIIIADPLAFPVRRGG